MCSVKRPAVQSERAAGSRGPLAVAAVLGLWLALPAGGVEFGRDVRPVLADRCFACHGPDEAQRQSGLRLDVRESATQPAASGKVAIAPGDPDASELLRRVDSSDAALRMPPAYMGHAPLAQEQVRVLKEWIEAGAPYERHWAFRPPARPEPPAVSDPAWVRQGLDAFILARLEEQRLEPSGEAPPERWLRRMMLDLHGLPPTPRERSDFRRRVERVGGRAFEEAADRVLSSPRFGERLALDWLDVARYADTHGFNNDSERLMWRWRDWVIGAFNENLPYDRFLTEQLAGDLLPNATLDQRIATGFNRNHVINSEGGIIEEEYRVEYVADRVRTVGLAWLGLTVECARCHDHKFDPVSQKDYYRLFAFFDNVPEFGEAGRVANAVPMLRAPTAEQRRAMAELELRISALQRRRAAEDAVWEPSPDALQRMVAPQYPANADLFVGCDDADAAGIAGRACGRIEISPEEPLQLDKHGAFTLGLWVRPSSPQSDSALFSAIDYSPDPASSTHGAGIELRLAGSEAELRLSKRYPSYSIGVRTEGAGIRAGQWHHVMAVYEGSEGKDSLRAEAAWVRLFVDGREAATRLLHDDVQSAVQFKPPYRLGHDNAAGSAPFEGWLDEVAVWKRALTEEEVRQAFEAVALPWALQRSGDALERAWLRRSLDSDAELEALRRELFALRRNTPTAMVMQEMGDRRKTRLLIRGRYDTPGGEVRPGVPESILGSWPAGAPENRLGLARWLTSGAHPTVARVVVNRFWQHLFGVGIVKTSGDFGLQGEAPSHPRLLDWLAVEFAESGWDVKRLLRTLVLSSAYRQESAVRDGPGLTDPENRLVSRGPRFRLPAEVIRDQALFLAGLLSRAVGGPSVRPYQPEGLYDGVVVGADYPGTRWVESEGEDLYRRSLYTFWKRTLPHPAMTVFDAPDREFCTARRTVTNTPLQALTLMNDPTFVEAARKLAERVLHGAAPDPQDRVRTLFEIAAGRLPDRGEEEILIRSLNRFLASYADSGSAAAELLAVGDSPADDSISQVELAAYAALASLVLNLDEVISKG